MKSQDSYKSVVVAGLWMFFLAVWLLCTGYNQFKHDGVALSELGMVLLFIALIGLFGAVLLAASYSKHFRRKYISMWEEDAPVIECKQCFYDLRGSVLAGSNKCPECGSVVPAEQVEQIKRLNQGIKNKKQKSARGDEK